jgi:hypothetical protein
MTHSLINACKRSGKMARMVVAMNPKNSFHARRYPIAEISKMSNIGSMVNKTVMGVITAVIFIRVWISLSALQRIHNLASRLLSDW